ncbi:SRPBCC family protein [Phytohabitans kaempferiae]|uniref:SRPBCC family protein n=1 Tax=Phytohabitans kaempferiae TaxID=1620943 RepID=A0ABV6MG67_9ACTN
MSAIPTGRLFRTESGVDLVLTRTFRAPAEDVWASLTEPERTARWFGPWEGTAAPGGSVKVRMVFEEGQPWMEMRVEACEPPRRLELSAVDDHGTWHTSLRLSEVDGGTEVRFTQHLADAEGIQEVGPGWEYYLDLLVAARAGTPPVRFDDYYPAQKAYYEGLTAE